MILQECLEMRRHDRIRNYFFKWWNIIMITMLTLFVMAGLSWIAGFAITGGWSINDYSVRKYAKNKDGYNLLLLGNSFFSVATVFSVIHLIDFCQVRRNGQSQSSHFFVIYFCSGILVIASVGNYSHQIFSYKSPSHNCAF